MNAQRACAHFRERLDRDRRRVWREEDLVASPFELGPIGEVGPLGIGEGALLGRRRPPLPAPPSGAQGFPAVDGLLSQLRGGAGAPGGTLAPSMAQRTCTMAVASSTKRVHVGDGEFAVAEHPGERVGELALVLGAPPPPPAQHVHDVVRLLSVTVTRDEPAWDASAPRRCSGARPDRARPESTIRPPSIRPAGRRRRALLLGRTRTSSGGRHISGLGCTWRLRGRRAPVRPPPRHRGGSGAPGQAPRTAGCGPSRGTCRRPWPAPGAW